MAFYGEHFRALDLLARRPNGRTETFMLIHGCTRQYLDRLIRAGLATATKQRVGRGRQIEITRIKLTEGGRATLTELLRQRIRDGGKPRGLIRSTTGRESMTERNAPA
jgi:DNA-binding PadR family transcriptional regulator